MALTPQDVRQKLFSTAKKGYNEDEVDDFLDEVEAELIRLIGENEDLRARLDQATSQPQEQAVTAVPTPPAEAAAPVTSPAIAETEDMLRRTLLLAQRTADEAVAEAKQEAERLVSEAMERAVTLERKASEEHAQVMGDLDDKRRRLESQIEQLRSFEREYRTRLRAYLEMQLRELEASAAAGATRARPTEAVTTARPAASASTAPSATPSASGAAAPAPLATPPAPAASPFSTVPPAGGVVGEPGAAGELDDLDDLDEQSP